MLDDKLSMFRKQEEQMLYRVYYYETRSIEDPLH